MSRYFLLFSVLIFFSCKKCTNSKLSPYFEGISWESVDLNGKATIKNGKYIFESKNQTQTVDFEIVDDKRASRVFKNEKGIFRDTFYVSIIKIDEKPFLILHDSTSLFIPFACEKELDLPELDNHTTPTFSVSGVSVGQTIPIGLLENVWSDDTVHLTTGLRHGRLRNNSNVWVSFSKNGRVAEINRYDVLDSEIEDLIESISSHMSFRPKEGKDNPQSSSHTGVFTEKKYYWASIGSNIDLKKKYYFDKKLNAPWLYGKRTWDLWVCDDFLKQAVAFQTEQAKK